MKRFPGTPATPPDPGGLPPGAVLRLHRVGPGSGLPPTTAMLELLDDVERARAARAADAAQSAAFVAGRFLLRALAADLLGTRAGLLVSSSTCPACGPAGPPDHGRPGYLLHGERVPLALSLSRTGGFVLLGALGMPGPHAPTARPGLGVDLAAVAAVDFDGFDDAALTPGERRAVGRLPLDDRGAARARLWARKEALVKALGTGFADREPDAVDVLRERRITDLPSVDGEALEPLGLVAAVAVESRKQTEADKRPGIRRAARR